MPSDDRIAALEAEVKALHARVEDVFEALKFESSNTTEHLGKVHELMTEIHEYLFPVVHRLFPGIAKTNRQIAGIMRDSKRT